MAIGWLSIIQLVPWSDVIRNAPKVAEGAKKLWDTVSRKQPALDVPAARAQPALSPEARSIALLQTQLAAAEAAISDLHDQMLESTELIKALADQNTELIRRVEANRVRVLWLAGITVIVGVVAAVGLAMALAR
ncbi:MAG: hypothetical protein ACM3KD_13300 [Hyphomicrobiaceae bacterium]